MLHLHITHQERAEALAWPSFHVSLVGSSSPDPLHDIFGAGKQLW